jgi:hypothetical protein
MGPVACNGKNINAYKMFGGKLEGKKLLRRSRHSWKENIKMDLREI